jgi:hypothetical protein
MRTLNRSLLVVTPKQPFLDWLHRVDPTSKDITLAELTSEPSVYLFPESETDEGLMRNLRKFCAEIFVEELDAWYRDEEVWPEDRSFKVFRLWFDYKQHSLVFDLSDKPLIRK